MIFHFVDADFGRRESPWMKHSRRGQGGGYDTTPPADNGPTTPAAPPGPSPWDMALQPFNDALPGIQAGIQANQGKIGGMADKANQAGQGIDPRFGAYANALQTQLQTQRTAATNQLSSNFANTGMGNSTAAVNELNRVNTGYDQQAAALTGQLGLQGLQRGDQASQFAAGLYGEQNKMGNDYLQNYLANPALQIGMTAAQNAGNSSGGGGKGGGK